MKNLYAIVLGLITFSTSLFPENLSLVSRSETWTNPASTVQMVRSVLPKANSEKEVRAQIAGLLDTCFGGGLLFVPESIEFIEYGSHPTFYLKGVSHADFKERECGLYLVFMSDQTESFRCIAPRGEELPDPKDYIDFTGDSSPFTEEAFDFMRPNLDKLKIGITDTVVRLLRLRPDSSE
jgi:hypothetical protein